MLNPSVTLLKNNMPITYVNKHNTYVFIITPVFLKRKRRAHEKLHLQEAASSNFKKISNINIRNSDSLLQFVSICLTPRVSTSPFDLNSKCHPIVHKSKLLLKPPFFMLSCLDLLSNMTMLYVQN